MTLADRLATTKPLQGRNGPPCSVGLLLDTLTGSKLEALEAALANRFKPGSDIEQDLRAEGYRVGSQQVARHRRGACKCKLQGRHQ